MVDKELAAELTMKPMQPEQVNKKSRVQSYLVYRDGKDDTAIIEVLIREDAYEVSVIDAFTGKNATYISLDYTAPNLKQAAVAAAASLVNGWAKRTA
jgi:hypothetical protein